MSSYKPAPYKPLPGLQLNAPPETLPSLLFDYGLPGPFYFDQSTKLYQTVPQSRSDTDSDSDFEDSPNEKQGQNTGITDVCANMSRTGGRPWGHWVKRHLQEFGDRKVPFLNRVACICDRAQLLECNNADCIRNYQSIDKVVPSCSWKPFRDCIMTAISCQISVAARGTADIPATSRFFHLAAFITLLNELLEDYKREGTQYDGVFMKDDKGRLRKSDPFEVCEVIYWAIRVQRYFGTADYSEGIWSPHFIPLHVHGQAVKTAITEATELGICPNRLWNLRNATERGEVDFPALVELVKANPTLANQGHEDCLTSFCTLTALDSTRVQQLHKCQSSDVPVTLLTQTYMQPNKETTCGSKTLFDPRILNEAAKDTGFWTVWSIDQPPRLLEIGKKYAAISHVWSDGTGIGLGQVGLVNSCLFDYFADCIRDVSSDVEGIWWDTISIPTEPVARRKAINEMHNYYADAECTILHDSYLANFKWKEDGSPCLAIVLSSWFTRGWTALEFIMSKRIKVIFKDPSTGGRILKDLDNDILVQNACQASTGYLTASSILKRLRQPIGSVHDLLSVLKPRSTSWARDKMLIAALLSGVEIRAGDNSQILTKRVLGKLGRIDALALLHDQPTIAETGGWSWCPASLYDMPVGEIDDYGEEFIITENGAVDGRWYCRRIDHEDIANGIIPVSLHPQVIFKIQNALRDWHNCGLLRKHSSDKGPCLLVELSEMGLPGFNTAEEGQRTWQVSADGGVQNLPWHKARIGEPTPAYALPDTARSECGYIGAVHVHELGRLPNGKSANPNRSSYVAGMYRMLYGGSHYHPELTIKRRNELHGAQGDFSWLHDKLWIGNQIDPGTLLIPRYDRVNRKTVLQIVKSARKVQNFSSRSSPFELPTQVSPPDWKLATEPFMTASDKDDGIFRYKAKEMVFRRVKPDPLWPPIEIPSDARTAIDWRHSVGAESGGDYSKDLFQVFDDEELHTYAALDKKLLIPTEARPYQGIWVFHERSVSAYGMNNGYSHFVLFLQTDETRLCALSISGGGFIRRGEVIFQTNNLPRLDEDRGSEPIIAHPSRDHQQDDTFNIKLHLPSQDEVYAKGLRDMGLHEYNMVFARLPCGVLLDLMKKDAFEESPAARMGLGALARILARGQK